MSEELKPCPFCGGESRMHVAFASGGDHSVGVYVECLECRSWSGTKWGDGAQEKAAEAWNRRAERTCQFFYDEKIDEYACSACGERVSRSNPADEYKVSLLAVLESFEYCPNCGARVLGE